MTTFNMPKSLAITLFCFTLSVSFQAKSGFDKALAEKITAMSCDKQIVVLGELPSHGEALGFQAKADVVQLLNERCGFDTVFFEAPLYDFLGFQKTVLDQSAKPVQLDMAIGGFWLSQELAEWRQWLYTQAMAGHLKLAGLDDQISATSAYARSTLPSLVESAFTDSNKTKCAQAISRNLSWSYDEEYRYDQQEKNLLQNCTHQTFNILIRKAEYSLEQKKMAENMANLYARNNNMSVAFDRDEAMFNNFEWQYKRLPKGSKVIIWTATVHAAKQKQELRHKPLGAWLHEIWNDDMISIGFTAYSGQSSMAGMPSKEIKNAPADSLEALVTQTDSQWLLINHQQLQKLGEISARLYGRFITLDWSTNFDGVVIIKQEQAPTFDM